MIDYGSFFLTLLLITALASVVTTRISIALSHKFDILDRPDPRKAHREPIAYLGGLGMFLGFGVGLVTLLVLQPDFSITHQPILLSIITGAVLIFCVGFIDDVRPVRAILKLGLQIGVAALMWYLGVRISKLSFLGEEIANIASFVITIGWYVALMNSINLVDGLDGLAGGICCIGALSLVGVGLVIGYSADVLLGASLATLVAGATLGYLYYNWHPAKTFMGDSGSLLLGFLLATASLIGSTKTPTLLTMSVPLVALGLPIFESSFSFLRRALSGQHPFKPDRRHLHHRLLDVGLDQRRVVITLLFMTAILGVNSIMLAQAGLKTVFFNVVLLIVGIILLIENLKFLEKKRIRWEQEQASETARMHRSNSATNVPTSILGTPN
ncbi:N/A [soil metagenome]